MNDNEKCCGLSGNALKIIAALSMLIDHVGFILLPEVRTLRVVGRLAFPIYAFMISEGCEHTKSKLRYFISIFALGMLCQAAYYVYDGGMDMGILITFSISVLLIYALQAAKEILLDSSRTRALQIASGCAFVLLVADVYALNKYIDVDYGFWGCVVPLFASLFRQTGLKASPFEGLDTIKVHVLMLGVGLTLLSYDLGGLQWYSLCAVPLLLFYSGKRGKRKMKSFFYIFYPAHLAALELVAMVLK